MPKYFGAPLEFDEGPISISTEIKNVSRQKFFAYEVLRIAKYFAYRNTSLCEILRMGPLQFDEGPISISTEIETFRLQNYFAMRSTSHSEVLYRL